VEAAAAASAAASAATAVVAAPAADAAAVDASAVIDVRDGDEPLDARFARSALLDADEDGGNGGVGQSTTAHAERFEGAGPATDGGGTGGGIGSDGGDDRGAGSALAAARRAGDGACAASSTPTADGANAVRDAVDATDDSASPPPQLAAMSPTTPVSLSPPRAALDCGAGLGRVARNVLLPGCVGRVTLVEQSAKWLDVARRCERACACVWLCARAHV